MNGRGRWRSVSVGLKLKLVALGVLLMTPLVALACWKYRWPLVEPIAACILAAAVIDLVGRWLCLAAPVVQRLPIMASVVLQSAAVVTIVLFWVGLGDLGLMMGLTVGLCLQVLAAFSFTRFLNDLALLLRSTALEGKTDRLRRSMIRTLLAGSGFGMVSTIAGAAVVVGAFFLFYLAYFVVIAAGVAILPFALLALVVLGGMFTHYYAALKGILQEIELRAQRVPPVIRPRSQPLTDGSSSHSTAHPTEPQ